MKKKLKPCLKCDKPILTTPEWRLCTFCRAKINECTVRMDQPNKDRFYHPADHRSLDTE
jgi:hypothetical protein